MFIIAYISVFHLSAAYNYRVTKYVLYMRALVKQMCKYTCVCVCARVLKKAHSKSVTWKILSRKESKINEWICNSRVEYGERTWRFTTRASYLRLEFLCAGRRRRTIVTWKLHPHIFVCFINVNVFSVCVFVLFFFCRRFVYMRTNWSYYTLRVK